MLYVGRLVETRCWAARAPVGSRSLNLMARSKSPGVRSKAFGSATPSRVRGKSNEETAGDDKYVGLLLRTFWPGDGGGWFNGSVLRLLPSGKYECQYDDGTLVLLTADQIKQYEVKSASPSPKRTPASVVSATQHNLNGVWIVILSAAMSCLVADWARRHKVTPLYASMYMMLGNAAMCLAGNWYSH